MRLAIGDAFLLLVVLGIHRAARADDADVRYGGDVFVFGPVLDGG
jgi:hypothetical protein